MTVMWLLDIHGRPGPKHLVIADAISEAVADGSLPAGARLPVKGRLAYDLGVPVETVAEAFEEAARRGLIESGFGKENWVRSDGAGKSTERKYKASDEPRYGSGDDTVVTVVLCNPGTSADDTPVGRAYPSETAFDQTPKGRRYGEWW